jgi:Holliday junction resolvase
VTAKAGSEAAFKTGLCRILRGMGCYVLRTVTGGGDVAGTPDLLVCRRGRFVALEAKRDAGAEATPWQARRLKEVRDAGGRAFVIFPANADAILEIIEREGRND